MHISLRAPALSWRGWLLILVSAVLVVAVAAYGPIPQPLSYHNFADQRTLLGIPHFWNVVSNLPFLMVGGYGLVLLWRDRNKGKWPFLWRCYAVFFTGVAFVFAGSAYYHLHPDNNTLVWDRLPMTLAFTAYFVAVLGERLNAGWARYALIPALVIGVLSVIWWHLTGDLRLYVLVQFLPVVLIPLVVLLYPCALPRANWVWGLILAYLVAKGLEFLDEQIYALLGVGGHGFKHLAAAAGVCFVTGMVKVRGELEE